MTSLCPKDTKTAKTQVRAVEIPQVVPLLLPHFSDPGSTSDPHSYHSLSLCLRTNVFPGAATPWKSLSRDSYIRHPLTAWPADPDRWYGHKTDEVVEWTERNILNQRLKKLLTEMEKRRTAK